MDDFYGALICLIYILICLVMGLGMLGVFYGIWVVVMGDLMEHRRMINESRKKWERGDGE